MRATTFQPALVQQFAKLLGAAAMVTGELDRLVAHFSHRCQGTRQVFGAVVSHRVEFKGDRDLFAGFGGGE